MWEEGEGMEWEEPQSPVGSALCGPNHGSSRAATLSDRTVSWARVAVLE